MNDSAIHDDFSPYEIWQLENKGNVLPESTNEEIEKEDQRMVIHFELQILTYAS